jgi:AraC-like DNA-binding protein
VDTYTVESTSTDELPPLERAGFWSAHITAYQSALDYRFPCADFSGSTIRQRSPDYQLVEYWSGEIIYNRTSGQVRHSPDEDYRFLIPLAGEMSVRQDGRQTRLEVGTGSLVTFAAPVELVQGLGTHGFIMTIPAHQVDGPLGRSSPLAAGLDLTAGLGRVVGDMVSGLARERDSLACHQFAAVCDRLVELLCMIVAGDDRPDAPAHLAEVEALVRRYVRAHAADPELTGKTIAQDLGWSLRQIQLALQRADTTPRDLIREERLRLVRRRLQDPAYHHLPITDLAYASGFSSASALSTAFRHRYGTAPREVRLSTEQDT